MSSAHILSICLFSVMFCSVWTAVLQRDEISETSVAIPAQPDSVEIVDERTGNRMRRQFVGNSYNMAGVYPHYNPLGSGSAWAAGGGLVGNSLAFIIG